MEFTLDLTTAFLASLHLGKYGVRPHIFFEALAYFIATRVYLMLRHRFGDPLSTTRRWVVISAAIAGGALGSKFLYWLEDPERSWRNVHSLSYLMGGKTIVGALVFGLISVELMKRYIGLREPTGDLYAIPLAVGIAIGRVGCFLTGLSDDTYGTPTTLPWAVDFGDSIPRHPTQLYEIAFLILLIPILYKVLILSDSNVVRSGPTDNSRKLAPTMFLPGDTFKFFMVSYLFFRLLCDALKPYPRVLLGLEGIQWACLLTLVYYSPDIGRWLRASRH
jgi:phosphatidylglycerol---prolipoprotein diacylglyceryl transferase